MTARRRDRRTPGSKRRTDGRFPWAELPDEKLLDVRIKDLGVAIEGTALEPRIERLLAELAARELRLRPHFWLSTEWFSPDGVPGIAVPFFLAHPRLERLERKQMLEVEGGSERECMAILRHEAGHAFDTAYRLHYRRDWKRVFGGSRPYPEYYSPRPYSRRFVLHLDAWYAQSHPAEDFAETFAVWLRPGRRWRKTYAGWPALKKLEFVDRLVGDVCTKPPVVRSRRRVEPLSREKRTLREYYEWKHRVYGTEYPDFYDLDLKRLFSDQPRHRRREAASTFLRRSRRRLRRAVAHWTGLSQYTIDQVLREMIGRC
ncbi:MAG: putative zinc-binding metallopeptidase, partial [Planctomycetota bacterium]